LNSDDVRDVLAQFHNTHGARPLTLSLVDSKGNSEEVTFSVVSSEDERRLTGQLEKCNQQNGLMAYICRAYYFRLLRLYTEAAEEYDGALKQAPESIQLLRNAIMAQRWTGNLAREQELSRRLAPGMKPPN
jgi:hypothetical protein